MRVSFVAALLIASAAWAQSKPTLLDHPLEMKSGLTAAQKEKLQDDFRMLLDKRSGILVPTRTGWKTATNALNRQDCDVRDDCLRQLAVTGGTLYALYAQVEQNAAGTEAIATGRVVSQDGGAVRPATRATAPVKGTNFAEAAKKALDGLLDTLELEKLPPVLASTQGASPSTPPVAEAMEPLPAPPPPPTPEPDVPRVTMERSPGSPGLRAVAVVTTIAAVACAGVALGFGISAVTERSSLPADGRLVDEAQVQKQEQVNTGATVALGLGIGAGVLGVTSAILYVASGPSERPRVSAAPIPGGGALAVSGSF